MTPRERTTLIKEYKDGCRDVVDALKGISEQELDFHRASGKWSAREIVHHLADSETNSGIRLRKLLVEMNPYIQGYDQDEFARKLQYSKRPVEPALKAFEAARETTSQILDLMTEQDWKRMGEHSELGPYSPEKWLEIYAPHARNHAKQIRQEPCRIQGAKMMRDLCLVLILLAGGGLVSCTGSSRAADTLDLQKIKLPPGFSITVYADNVPNARQMALGSKGTVFAGSRNAGKVYAIVNGKALTIAQGLNMPSGIAFKDGALYVAEVSRVTRYDNIEANLTNPPKPVVVNDKFPHETLHGWKFIAFGPDGKLYVPVGAPCNACTPDERHALISRMAPDGSNVEVVARGVRNSVGFDWDPRTGELWFTDNGRDGLGDNIPPDELNHVTQQGMHFGFPYCHAGTIQDPDLGKEPCSKFVPPAIPLGPHAAAIGMAFYTGQMFPTEYRNQIFIAEHGSWNRSIPIGYRISVVRVEGNRAVKYEPFAEGWLQGNKAWGRPASVLVMRDGALLVSDDERGAIYRIAYQK